MGAATAVADEPVFHVDPGAGELLEQYCFSCHEDGTEKGDVRLDNLGELSLSSRLDLMNRMQEQIYLKQMPPPKKKTQPSDEERAQLGAWLWGDLHAHNASKLEDKLRYPSYGNYVDHDKLFSGTIGDAAYTPARRWLVNPQIFTQRVLDIFGLEGKERGTNLTGVTNPFLLTDSSGVRDYDNNTLDGGHLLVMLTNADWISSKQIRPARVKNGELGVNDFPDPKEKWSPRLTPPEFEAVILKKSAPTDKEINDAVRKQFVCVLRREPTREDQDKYLKLTRAAVELGGNTEGLRQMLVAVLLESEFLYRLEFGDGNADRYGRKMLSPREGAYAISYAMGDRGPDAALLKAASEGRLNTGEDYKREVQRLLDDPDYYQGSVDAALTTSPYRRTLETSHPKIVRFFREFFGYPNATKVFKDRERSGFYYDNPERGTFGTPGELVNEADMLVDWCLNKDQHVFENLLGSEEYFVAPVADAAKKIEMLEEVYEHFKDTDWKNNPEKVAADNLDYLGKTLGYRSGAKQLTAAMIHVIKFREKKLRPNPDWNYAFGTRLMLWVNSYDIAPFDWTYPVQQPFKLSNRKGILTHPAWLIAHSQNTQSDPVRRGRWVREKLLAGRVPDIPITVDAVIPEDHQNTLRSRLEKVTSAQECIKCHQYMNPLGVPFESYDDFGRFRTQEPLEHPENAVGKAGSGKYQWDVYKTLPVDSRGVLDSTGDSALDGDVTNAMDMIGRLAKSTRARQSIIRYAFRFYMGRNELLSDSKTLIDADNAYVKSGGSFRAVIVSLLTSDSFIYRK